jgi:hypothetical protein
MSTVDCPYYQRDYKRCKLFDTSQDESRRNSSCQTSDNWKYCPNYTGKSYEEKLHKSERPDPYL